MGFNTGVVPIFPIFLHIFTIILLSVVSYSNTFSNSFHFDDRYAIFEDRAIRDIGNIPAILKDVFSRPLLRVTFALNYYFSEVDVFAYHLTNLILHITVSICIYFLSWLLFKRFASTERDSVSFSLMSALIFALHPIQTGSVTYIASRSAVLATLFYTLAIILFIIGFEKEGLRKIYLYFGAFFSFFLGIGVKEIILTVPFIITLLTFYLITIQGKRFNRDDVIVCSLWLLTLPVYALVKYASIQYVIPVDARFAPGEILSPYQYLLTELNVVVFYYLKWLFMPIDGPHTDPDIPPETSFMDISTISASLIILGLIYFSIRSVNPLRKYSKISSPPLRTGLLSNGVKGKPIVSFAILWYFITLIPTSSIFPIADVAVERHVYLPSIGFALLSSYFLLKVKALLPSKIRFIPYLVPILLIGITIKTNFVWKNEITLWEDAAIKAPNKARVLGNRAFAYFEAGDIKKAEFLYNDFLKRFPDDAIGYNNMGLIYEKKGDLTSAIKYYKEAIRLRPRYYLFYMHLGNAYNQAGLMNEAIMELQTAVNLEPSNPELLVKLASFLAKTGEVSKVIDIANIVLVLEPKNAMAFSLLGISYERKGLKEEAVKYYKMALELNPGWEPLIEKIKGLEERNK